MAIISNGTTIASGGSLSVSASPPNTLGAIGSYAILTINNSSQWAQSAGTTMSGSSLRYSNCMGENYGSAPSGTWRLMGQTSAQQGVGEQGTSVWIRIS